MQTVISFILMFGALVFVHELGHLIFAKRSGVLCREFAIGMGPKILSFTKNETLYTIRLLPIGGYVKMAGEEPEQFDIKPGQQIGFLLNDQNKITKIINSNFDKFPTAYVMEVQRADLEKDLVISFLDDNETSISYSVMPDAIYFDSGKEMQIAPINRQFHSKKLWQRALTIFGGPMMNFVFAVFLFLVIGFFQGVFVDKPVLGKIVPNDPAAKAGLLKGDVVEKVGGVSVDSWTAVVKNIQKHPNENVTFTILRNKKVFDKDVLIEAFPDDAKTGRIGVYAPSEKAPLKVVTFAIKETYTWTIRIGEMFRSLILGAFSIDDLSGPVGIYSATDQVVKSGLTMLINWAAILSINLGIVNLLPLPALDGGRLMFMLIELFRGKPISREKEGIVHFIGFALLMLLMVVVTWNDIQKLFN